MSRVTTRRLQVEDASAYRTIRLDALQESPLSFCTTYEEEEQKPFAKFEELMQRAFVLGAYVDDNLLGVIRFEAQDGIRDGHKAELSGLYVRPVARHSGLASLLIDALLDSLPARTEQVNLTVASSNSPAINLYARKGFHCYGVEPNAVKVAEGQYVSELLMLKLMHPPYD